MKKLRLFRKASILMMLSFILLSGCQSGNSSTENSQASGQDVGDPYKIGAIFAITGPASSLGIPERDTILMLKAELEEQGGIVGPDGLLHPVEVIIYDTESDETKAVLAAKKLIEEDKVSLIIGPTQSGTTLAVVDTVDNAQIPLISCAASIQIVEPVEERLWVFKTAPSDRLVVSRLIQHLQDEGISNVAWMSVNNAFGDSGKVEFDAAAPLAGINIVAVEKFEATDSDMTAQLTNIQSSGAEALIVWSIPPSASAVTKNAYELGMSMPVFHSHGIGNQTFIELATLEAAEGVVFPVGKIVVASQLPDDDPQKLVLVGYVDEYEQLYGQVPVTFGGHAWDALKLAVQVMQEVGDDREAIRDALESTEGFIGIGGIFNFSSSDHNGLDLRAITMVRIENGEWMNMER